MKALAPVMVVALSVAGCGIPAAQGNLGGEERHRESTAERPIFQLPVLPGRPGVGYFAVDVPADHGALIGVTSPQAGRIEMHETMQSGSMSSMRPLQRIAPDNGRIVMARGRRHLMIFDVDPALATGGTARLVLRFEHGQTRTLAARVVEAGGEHGGH